MSAFRHVEESKGATLPIDSEIPAVGTWNLLTCVGVYFKIDERRCFIAHINTPSLATYPYNVVTDKAGKVITSQLVNALDKHAKHQEWDVRDQHFGKDLILQCPAIDDLRRGEKRYKRGALFAVEGVHQFFTSCAEIVDEEFKQRTNDRQLKQMKKEETKAFDANSAQLEVKAMFLKAQGRLAQVDKIHHCFIVTPSTGEVIRIGNFWENSPKKADLGQHSPVTVDLKFTNFFFLVTEDDESDFDSSLRNPKGLAAMVEHIDLRSERESKSSKSEKGKDGMSQRKGG